MPSVLLVHGDARTRDSVALALSEMGWQTTVCADAASGWTAVLQDAFDLMLWDAAQTTIEGDALSTLLTASGHQGPVWTLTTSDLSEDAFVHPDGERGLSGRLIWSGQIDEAWRQALAPLLPEDGDAPSGSAGSSRWEGLTFEALPGFERLLARYRQRLPGQMADICAAWRQHDRASLQHLAHALKGTAECFGLPEVSRLAAQIEHTAAQGEAAVVASWIGQLDAVVREAVGADGGAHAAGESV